jgi:hypothetical protein
MSEKPLVCSANIYTLFTYLCNFLFTLFKLLDKVFKFNVKLFNIFYVSEYFLLNKVSYVSKAVSAVPVKSLNKNSSAIDSAISLASTISKAN